MNFPNILSSSSSSSLPPRQRKSTVSICDECQTVLSESNTSDGFIVCPECGLAKDVFIDATAEWRCFSSSNGSKDLSAVRCGDPANALLPGTQLNTFMAPNKNKKYQRIHLWNNLSPRERNLHQVFKEFEQIGVVHNLPKNVISTATELYSRLYTEMETKNCGVKRCNVRQGLKAACLYFSCKQYECPRERKEIAEMLGNTTKIVTKGCNYFLDIMGGEYITMEPFKPEDFVARFSQLLELPYNYQMMLKKIVQFVSTFDSLSDNTPTSVTSACIFFIACEFDIPITKDQIHQKCGSSQVIISKTYNKIIAHREEILKHAN